MSQFCTPPRPPWFLFRTPTPETPQNFAAEPSPLDTPATRLLRAHLQHGCRARREAAAFALVLTQPAAACAIRDFFTARRSGAGREE